ncbi:hypothetical protein AAE478_009952 [Parahypoxylon ruwenzoriense]
MSQLENSLAKEFKYKPVVPRVPYSWPLAFDLLQRQYKIFFSDHTFEQLTKYFNIAGTVRIELFGVTGYFTCDPDNDGPAWKHSRELIRPQFMRVQKQTLQVFEPHATKLVQGLKEPSENGIVDMKSFFFEYTLNTTTELLFGETHSSLAKEERDAARSNFDYAAFGMGIRVRLADLAFLYNPPKFRKACKAVQDWATFFARKALRYKNQVGE